MLNRTSTATKVGDPDYGQVFARNLGGAISVRVRDDRHEAYASLTLDEARELANDLLALLTPPSVASLTR